MLTCKFTRPLLLTALLLAPLTALAAEEKAAVPAPIRSDGSVLNESFDAGKLPKGWEQLPSGGNRRDVTFKDGACIFNHGKGDNYLDLPALPINLDEPFVVEITFSVPAMTVDGYSLFSMNRVGGELVLGFTEGSNGTLHIGLRGVRTFGVVELGKTYTVAVMVKPDGSCTGTLTGGSIEKPMIQSGAGPEGAIKGIMLGNGRGLAVGGMRVESIKIGLSAK